jgi:predicted nucleic acid-binding protein
MSADVFVDTNVLVYARDAGEPVKQPVAADWMAQLWSSRRGRVSVQVLNEYFVTVTLKLQPGLPCETAWRDVTDLFAWKPVPADTAVLTRTRAIHGEHGLSWWDAQIVAAARMAGCHRLLTDDLQDGQEIDGVVVVNPFAHRVGEVLKS